MGQDLALAMDNILDEHVVAGPPRASGIFLCIPKDTWVNIAAFIKIFEHCKMKKTCRYAQDLLREGERLYFSAIFFRLFKQVPMKLNVLPEDAKPLIESMVTESRQRVLFNLIEGTLGCSSRDRAEERPSNVLRRSACFAFIDVNKNAPQLSSHSLEEIGQYAQLRQCGCAGHDPCYWSSQPSPTQDMLEYIAFSPTSSSLSLVAGFTVSPYQAFFQPHTPIYAPQKCILQFLLPSSVSDGSSGSGSVVKVLNRKQIFEAGDCYYQTAPFDMSNLFEPQHFCLPQPVLFSQGYIRLVMLGAHQRQTLGGLLDEDEVEAVPHAEDWYICISHVQLIGFHLCDFTARVDHVDHVDHVAGQTSDVSTPIPWNSLDDAASIPPPFHPAPSVRSITIRKRAHEEEERQVQVPLMSGAKTNPLPEPWVTPQRSVIDLFFRGL